MVGTLRKRSTRVLPPVWLLVLSALIRQPAFAADAQDASAEPSADIAQASTPQDDGRIADRLRGIFAEIDSLHGVEVSVSAGVVALGGQVDSLAVGFAVRDTVENYIACGTPKPLNGLKTG